MRRNVAMIGLGAIGHSLAKRLAEGDGPKVTAVLARPGRAAAMRLNKGWPGSSGVVFCEDMESLCHTQPDVLVECAGPEAVQEHVQVALEAGIDVILASTGALADPNLFCRLAHAARKGGATLAVCAGAVGAIDALSAARLAGLDQVTYTSRKPAIAFRGTKADVGDALEQLTMPQLLFSGPADAAARTFPRNANVAMTVALAGLGAAQTMVRIYVDPHISANSHEITATGLFGTFTMKLENTALRDNPKTSLLTILSLERLIRCGYNGVAI